MEQQIQQETRDVAYVLADTETTDLTGPACEVALHEICPHSLDMLWEIDSLIDPGVPIEPGAMAIHGITDEMVQYEPTMDEFLEHRLKDRFAGRDIVLICHNAPFDVKRLHMIGNVTASICTLFHARQLIPKKSGLNPDGPENHKLTTLREYFGFPVNEAHRALADVYTTKRLLREILGRTHRTLPEFLATMDTTIHRMPFGKHAGQLMMDVPRDYLLWLKKESGKDMEPNLKNSIDKILKVK